MTLLVPRLINYRWWFGRKVRVGAAEWRGIRNDFHRSCIHWDDGELFKINANEILLILIKIDKFVLQPENCLSSYDPHGFLVIYSSADRSSFLIAERVLQTLWTSENIAQRAVILVGNKADLARSRSITSEGEFEFYFKSDCRVENRKSFYCFLTTKR